MYTLYTDVRIIDAAIDALQLNETMFVVEFTNCKYALSFSRLLAHLRKSRRESEELKQDRSISGIATRTYNKRVSLRMPHVTVHRRTLSTFIAADRTCGARRARSNPLWIRVGHTHFLSVAADPRVDIRATSRPRDRVHRSRELRSLSPAMLDSRVPRTVRSRELQSVPRDSPLVGRTLATTLERIRVCVYVYARFFGARAPRLMSHPARVWLCSHQVGCSTRQHVNEYYYTTHGTVFVTSDESAEYGLTGVGLRLLTRVTTTSVRWRSHVDCPLWCDISHAVYKKKGSLARARELREGRATRRSRLSVGNERHVRSPRGLAW